MQLYRVISGAQDGADIAGLDAAKDSGIRTGGWMTADFRCKHTGCHPEYVEKYNVRAMPTTDYPSRTEKNVVDSEGTIRLAVDWNSAGEKCTYAKVRKHEKHLFDVDLTYGCAVQRVVDWIFEKDIRVLNVAGNARKDRQFYLGVYAFLRSTFAEVQRLSVPPLLDYYQPRCFDTRQPAFQEFLADVAECPLSLMEVMEPVVVKGRRTFVYRCPNRKVILLHATSETTRTILVLPNETEFRWWRELHLAEKFGEYR